MKKKIFFLSFLLMIGLSMTAFAEDISLNMNAGVSSVLAQNIKIAGNILSKTKEETPASIAVSEADIKKQETLSVFKKHGIDTEEKDLFITTEDGFLYEDEEMKDPSLIIQAGTVVLIAGSHIDTMSASGYGNIPTKPYEGESIMREVSVSSYARLMTDENGTYIGYIFPGEKAVFLGENIVSFMGKQGTVTDIGEITKDSDTNIPYIRERQMRRSTIETAIREEGKIPYAWGGKPDENNSISSGLDCSGFVLYCLKQTAVKYGIDIDTGKYYSTKAIGEDLPTSSRLTPGDLCLETGQGTYYTDINGIRFDTAAEASDSTEKMDEITGESHLKGSFTHADHVGFYVGHTKDGYLFCHENGKMDNVSVNDPGVFAVFRVPDIYQK